jgi:hypothetical protein
MLRTEYGLKIGVCSLVLLGGYGCGSKSAFKEQPLGPTQLMVIGRAYAAATDALDRPPQSKDEIKPYVHKDWAGKDVFRSPNDNEEFVILWGVDIRDFNLSGHPDNLPVLAYEKQGNDEKRLVLLGGRYVKLVADEDLAKLKFPAPYKAPL